MQNKGIANYTACKQQVYESSQWNVLRYRILCNIIMLKNS